MDPLIGGALISGGASLLGGMFSSDTSAENTRAQIQASQQMQATQNAFSERMSNTAYQRSSADMKAAGLNPMMMFGSGGPASSPQASNAQAPMPQNTHPLAKLGEAANQVVTTAISGKTFDKMTEEIANLREQQALTAATEKLRKQELETERHESLRRANVASLTGLQLPAGRFSAKEAEAKLSIPSWLRDAAVQGGYLGDKAGEVISPIGKIIGSALGAKNLGKRRTTVERANSRGDSSFEERFHY